MTSFNDDQGGYVIGIILLVSGSICLFVLFLLLYFNFYKRFNKYQTLHGLRDIVMFGLGVALVVMGSLLINRSIIMNIVNNYNIQLEAKFDTTLLQNVKIYEIDKNMKLPVSVNLRSKMPPVLFQGILKSCGANATSNCLRFHQTGKKKYQPSRLFIHYNARIYDGGNGKVDEGTSVAGLMQALMEYNACDEWIWPYDTFNFSIEPWKKAYEQAKTKKPVKCGYIYNTHDENLLIALKQHLCINKPVVFSVKFFDSFVKFNKHYKMPLFTGKVPMPTEKDKSMSGHYMLLCGYDDTKEHFIVQNSLSALVGDYGYFYFKYEYIKRYSIEFFTVEYAE
jgi:C1A family cysteine protease